MSGDRKYYGEDPHVQSFGHLMHQMDLRDSHYARGGLSSLRRVEVPEFAGVGLAGRRESLED